MTTTIEQEYVLGTHDRELQRLGFQNRLWSPPTIELWRLAGMSSVALLLVVACVLGMPLGFAWLLTIAGLPYFVWVLWIQRRADRLTLRVWTE